MQGKGAYHQEIEKLQEARANGVSRIDQVQEERRHQEVAEGRRHKSHMDDDDDFIDNTGEDLSKTMRRVKLVNEDEENGASEGALQKSLRQPRVSDSLS
jgi:hypothetical protein